MLFFLETQPHFELKIVDLEFAKFWQLQAWLGGFHDGFPKILAII
jgi:hypothetical protein